MLPAGSYPTAERGESPRQEGLRAGPGGDMLTLRLGGTPPAIGGVDPTEAAPPLVHPTAEIAGDNGPNVSAAYRRRTPPGGLSSVRQAVLLVQHRPIGRRTVVTADPGCIVLRAVFRGRRRSEDDEHAHRISDSRKAVMSVVSDDHNAGVGEAAARKLVADVVEAGGVDALVELAVELAVRTAAPARRSRAISASQPSMSLTFCSSTDGAAVVRALVPRPEMPGRCTSPSAPAPTRDAAGARPARHPDQADDHLRSP